MWSTTKSKDLIWCKVSEMIRHRGVAMTFWDQQKGTDSMVGAPIRRDSLSACEGRRGERKPPGFHSPLQGLLNDLKTSPKAIPPTISPTPIASLNSRPLHLGHWSIRKIQMKTFCARQTPTVLAHLWQDLRQTQLWASEKLQMTSYTLPGYNGVHSRWHFLLQKEVMEWYYN